LALLIILVKLLWLNILEFVREEVIAILGMVFVAFFSQISMEVHYVRVLAFYSTYCVYLIQISCLLCSACKGIIIILL